MNFIYDAQKAMGNLQERVIGLFKIRGTTHIDLVVDKEGDLLKTVHVGTLAGISVDHIPAEKGKLIMFEDGLTLSELKKNPFKLQEIVEEMNK